MDRVSGWYKRRLQIVTLVVSIVLVASTNVDTFTIGERLWKDDALRAAVVAQAARQTGTTSCSGTDASENAPLNRAAECMDRVELDLPVGWTAHSAPDGPAGWAGKAGGLLFTALALLLGAPFWFDFLGKFARLRGAGNREGTAKTGRAAIDRDERS